MEYKDIKQKADYCLSCKTKPCVKGCPLENDITEAIKCVKEEKIKEAYDIFSNTSVLSGICGRICPHEGQCQGKCIRGIKSTPVEIGKIEAFVADEALKNEWKTPKFTDKVIDKKVAIVGGGPAGITCAAFLKRYGVKEVIILEKYLSLGGIMMHSIPDFRLDKELLNSVLKNIVELGIEVRYNSELGRDYTLADLEKEYDAIFIGIGANVSSKMGIQGEKKQGVFGGNELLEYKKYPDFKGKKVAVIGGGNVAMDVSRTIQRMGAESVSVIYRRSRNEMPAQKKEVEAAISEGVEFLYQTNVTKIIGDKEVEKIECIKTELVKKDTDTRPSPVNIEGSQFLLDIDIVVMALGSNPQIEVMQDLEVEKNKRGKIVIDECSRTSKKKIYAGGDIVGAGSIAYASRQGRNAAQAIIEDLNAENI